MNLPVGKNPRYYDIMRASSKEKQTIYPSFACVLSCLFVLFRGCRLFVGRYRLREYLGFVVVSLFAEISMHFIFTVFARAPVRPIVKIY